MKKSVIYFLFILVVFSVFAVDWPQSTVDLSVFSTQFADSRGSSLSAGVVYSNSETVKAADAGEIIFISSESKSLEQFDSPLGNTLIVANEEKLLNIYGNMDTISIKPYQTSVSEKENIGKSGSSSWQGNDSGLEFQVADMIQKTLINPFILFSKPEGDQLPALGNVVAVRKNGTIFDLSSAKILPSDLYFLYCNKTSSFFPFRVTVFVNGKEVENLRYDMLKIKANRLSLNGKNDYIFEEVFPDNNRHLISSVVLNKGKTVVMIKIYDISGGERTFSYSFEVR